MKKKNYNIIAIITISFITKMSIVFYQYYHNKKNDYIEYDTEENFII